jgi:hypothetical protein
MPATKRSTAYRSDEIPVLLSRRETAAALRVSEKTVDLYTKQGVLPAYKVQTSNRVWYKRSDVANLLKPVTKSLIVKEADDDGRPA